MHFLSRGRNFLFLLGLFFSLFSLPSGLFAQTAKELPCKTVEEAIKLLSEEQAKAVALRAELARRLAEIQVAATAAKPTDHTDQTIALRIALNGKAVIGSGTIIGCSPSESKPDKYACFVFTVAHFFEDQENKKVPVDPQNFTIKGGALFEGEDPTIANIPIKIIGIDRLRDVAIGLMYVDAPLPAAPLPPRGYSPSLLTPVVSVGCSSNIPRPYGDSKTCVIGVLADGIIQTNCPPKPGDSGGGIYDKSGYVIGTCLSFSELKDGTPLNKGSYALSDHAYNLIDRLRAHGGYTNIDFDKDGYLKVIPKSPNKKIR